MHVPRTTVAGLVTAALLGGAALGVELQRPSVPVAAHTQRNTAPRALINDPRIAGLLSESAQVALQPLLNQRSDLIPSPIMRIPRNGPAGAGPGSWTAASHPLAFNNDRSGTPQNEETVSTCNAGHTVVGGWNDFRNLAANGDITGWGLSTNDGASLANSNLLPGVRVSSSASGTGSGSYAGGGPASSGGSAYVPSAGDAIVRTLPDCSVFASSLLFQTDFTQPYVSGVLVDSSIAATLASCTTETACWPNRRAVAFSTDPSVFYDKPFMAIDPTPFNAAVWVGFTRFSFDPVTFQLVIRVEVVRCDVTLRHCSAPRVLATGGSNPYGFSVQVPTWTTIAVGSDGRTYASWATIQSGPGSPPTMQISVASAPTGTTNFGTPVTVTQLANPVLNPVASEAFRMNGMPDIAVSHVGGVDRVHVVYAQCRNTALGICEHSEVVLASSRSGAQGTWAYSVVDPGASSDFFPTLTADQATGNLLVGFWTTRFDLGQHLFDVLAVPVNAASGAPGAAIRVTASSIEPDSDSLMGPFFIGDYWELAAVNGKAWAHYMSTQRLQQLFGQGVQIPQQDNVLSIFSF
jgi:hypothetical protein